MREEIAKRLSELTHPAHLQLTFHRKELKASEVD